MKKLLKNIYIKLFFLILVNCSIPNIGNNNDNNTGNSTSGNGGATNNVSPTLLSINITPANPTLTVLLSANLTATSNYSDNTSKDVTNTVIWATSDNTKVIVSNMGVITGVAAGVTTVTATDNSTGISGTANITITSATMTTIDIGPINPSLAKGRSQQFTATASFNNGTTGDVSGSVLWNSSALSVATLNATGLASTLAQGSTIITATSGILVSNRAVLTVTAPVLDNIAVTPAYPGVPRGTSQQFTATGTYSDSSTADLTAVLTWASDTSVNATIMNTTGLATVPVNAIIGGISVISATNGTLTGTTTLTVGDPVLASITVTPANPFVPRGTTMQFSASGTNSDGTVAILGPITWMSDNTTNVTIDSSGLASAINTATIGGISLISATSGVITGTSTMTVSVANLMSISVTPVDPTVLTRMTKVFTATGFYSDGTSANLSLTSTWTSSNPAIATISANGIATVSYGWVGSTTITATKGALTASTLMTTEMQNLWYDGNNTVNVTGIYGAQGFPSAANMPGGRENSVSWIDASGNKWLFGGRYFTGSGWTYFNDLWQKNSINGDWAWIKGSNTTNASGVYGTMGVAAFANTPGARSGSVAWIDSTGNLWLFGGVGYDSVGSVSYLNDLWKFNPSTQQWTWIKGSNLINGLPTYGTQGTAAAANVPGARFSSISWKDSLGNAWLFGGGGIDSTGSTGSLNDLWKWNGSQWMWVSGGNTVNATGVYGTMGVAAIGNLPGARQGSIAWTSGTSLSLFGGLGYAASATMGNLNDIWQYSPSTGLWTWINGSNVVNNQGVYGSKGISAATNMPGAREQATAWKDSFGILWLFGGSGYDSGGLIGGLNDLWRWNGIEWTWVSGSSSTNTAAAVYGTMGVAALGNVPGKRFGAIVWVDTANQAWIFGGYGFTDTSVGELSDLWIIRP